MQLNNENMRFLEALFPDFKTFSSESQALLEKVIAHYISFKSQAN